MTACPSCGSESRRPFGALLLLAPILLGGVAALTVILTRARVSSLFVIAGITLAFLGLGLALVRYALALLHGRACPSCGRSLPAE
jgi:hypothetical protein